MNKDKNGKKYRLKWDRILIILFIIGFIGILIFFPEVFECSETFMGKCVK